MRRALGNAEAILPQQAAFLRHRVGDVVVLLHHLEDVAVPLHGEIHLAGGEQILAVVLGKHFDMGLLLDQHGLDLLDQLGVGGVERLPHVFEPHLNHRAAVRQQGDTAGVLIRVVQPLPAVRHAFDLGLAVADADGAPHVGQAVLAARVELGVAEHGIDIADVRDLGVIQRHQHVGHDHPLDIVVGRDDQVVARVAFLQLGEQLVVVGKEIHLDLDAGRFTKIIQRGLADVGVPVVEIEFFLLGGKALAGQEADSRGNGAHAGEKAPAGYARFGSWFHLLLPP